MATDPESVATETGEGSELRDPIEDKLTLKIDWHLIPCLTIMYPVAFLDRVNIGNAAVLGLKQELHIVDGVKYNTALTILFIPYILFEIPSNILVQKLRPHVWLSLCVFCFGVVTVCQGLVTTWAGLMTTRWFLGMFEAGIFPGSLYLLGMYYARHEAQRRFSFFFSAGTLAGAFGGLLASGLGKMDGLCGYAGWRWVFIIESILTCVVAAGCFFVLPDFPEQATWLTDEERRALQKKLSRDTSGIDSAPPVDWRFVLKTVTDPKIIIGGAMYFGQIVTAYGAEDFYGIHYCCISNIDLWKLPAIQTHLYSIPPWVSAFVFSMFTAWLSDKYRHRFAFAILLMMISMAGFGILLNVHGAAHRGIQHAALFLVTTGCYSAMPIIQVGFGNIGAIISTYSFREKDKPGYRPGYSICVLFLAFSCISCLAYLLAVWRENRRRDRIVGGGQAGVTGNTETLEDLATCVQYSY
ncbi:MFS transporter [Aspergillus heterothallicus]